MPVVLYSDLGDNTGWGNKLRGLYFAKIVSIALDTTLLVDFPLLREAYHVDSVGPTCIDEFEKNILSGKLLRPANRRECRRQLKQALDLGCLEKNILLCEGNHLTELILCNQSAFRRVSTVLGDDYSQWPLHALKRLRLQPKKEFFGAHSASSSRILVQYRTFADAGYSELGHMSNFVDVVLEFLGHRDIKMIEVATDCNQATSELARLFQSKGISAISLCKNISHTGSAVFPEELLCEDSTRNLIAQFVGRAIIDRDIELGIMAYLTKRRKEVASSKHLECNRETICLWERMRTCDICISNFTTFAKTAFATAERSSAFFRINHARNSLHKVFGFEDW